MAFNQQEPTTFISVKLTNKGRKELALGRLDFSRAVVSDREINYEFNRRYPSTTYFANLNPPEAEYYDFCQNRVLEPHDKQPALPFSNYDGSLPYDMGGKVFVSRQTVTAQTSSTGFWSATTTADSATINDYILHPDRWLTSGTTESQFMGGTTTFSATTTQLPTNGNLLLMRFSMPIGTAPTLDTQNPYVDTFFRIKSTGVTPSVIRIDRSPPRINTGTRDIYWYEYPFDGVSTYYGSAATQNTPVWNLNITRTSREIGMKDSAIGSVSGQSYSLFASKEYSGTKKFFGFDENTRQVGFIHYTNESTGNTYAEQLVPGTTEVDMPHILWHRKEVNPGVAETGGHRFTDVGSDVYYDQIARTSYTILKDGTANSSIEVGRVYYKLKLIVITDPELLTAMSYKTNRNWTLPKMIVGSQSVPQAPLTVDNASGLMKSDYYYYVTYWAKNNGFYDSSNGYGYQQDFHCGYVQKIEGYTDTDGYSQFLSCTFPSRAFPYLRNEAGFTTYSGTGWSTKKVQVLIQEVKKDDDPGIDGLHPGRWSGASDVSTFGNGVYSGLSTHNSVDPTYLQSHQFVISLEDIQSGTTQPNYTSGSANNLYGITTGFTNTDYTDSSANGLTLGNEDFFFGNIKTKIAATTFKTVFTIEVKDSELNGSDNGGFDGTRDNNTYITEFGILNTNGDLVAVGKPTFPIKKNSSRYLTFQLELDF